MTEHGKVSENPSGTTGSNSGISTAPSVGKSHKFICKMPQGHGFSRRQGRGENHSAFLGFRSRFPDRLECRILFFLKRRETLSLLARRFPMLGALFPRNKMSIFKHAWRSPLSSKRSSLSKSHFFVSRTFPSLLFATPPLFQLATTFLQIQRHPPQPAVLQNIDHWTIQKAY